MVHAPKMHQYADRRKRRVCVECEAPALPDQPRCPPCTEKLVEVHAERRAAGLCRRCSEPRLIDDVWCEKHQDAFRDRLTLKFRYEDGLCRSCPEPRAGDHAYCNPCWATRVVARERKEALPPPALGTSKYGPDRCRCCRGKRLPDSHYCRGHHRLYSKSAKAAAKATL